MIETFGYAWTTGDIVTAVLFFVIAVAIYRTKI